MYEESVVKLGADQQSADKVAIRLLLALTLLPFLLISGPILALYFLFAST